MAFAKKNRDVNLIHFSFFDLLFGALGAFIFLMIIQVLSTLNMVDDELVKMFDQAVKERNELQEQVEKLKVVDKEYQDLLVEHEALQKELAKISQQEKDIIQRMEKLEENNRIKEKQIAALQKLNEQLAEDKKKLEKVQAENLRLIEENEQLNSQVMALQKEGMELQLLTDSLGVIAAGYPVHLSLSARGGEPPYEWHIEGKLPAGLDMDPQTGRIEGMIEEPGSYEFGFMVMDQTGVSVASQGKRPLRVVQEIPQEMMEDETDYLWPMLSILFVAVFLIIMWIRKKIAEEKTRRYVEEMKRKGFDLRFVKGG